MSLRLLLYARVSRRTPIVAITTHAMEKAPMRTPKTKCFMSGICAFTRPRCVNDLPSARVLLILRILKSVSANLANDIQNHNRPRQT